MPVLTENINAATDRVESLKSGLDGASGICLTMTSMLAAGFSAVSGTFAPLTDIGSPFRLVAGRGGRDVHATAPAFEA
jgi:hypothetical protein